MSHSVFVLSRTEIMEGKVGPGMGERVGLVGFISVFLPDVSVGSTCVCRWVDGGASVPAMDGELSW